VNLATEIERNEEEKFGASLSPLKNSQSNNKKEELSVSKP